MMATNNSGLKKSEHTLSRRKLISTFGVACAGLLSQNTWVTGVSAYMRKPDGPVEKGQVLSYPQMRNLKSLVDIIIPATDTPGAGGVDTHGYIDDQLASCKSASDAKNFVHAIDKLIQLVEKQWGHEYADLPEKSQTDIMEMLANGQHPFSNAESDFFQQLKSLTIIGYYTSEIGGSQELVYLPIAGGYDGHFKLADNNGKAFSPFVY